MNNQVDYSDRAYDDLGPTTEGISAETAARALASRRWNKDETPVSDGTDLLTGADSVNASQNYTEMTNLAHDVKEAAAAELEPSAAATEIAEKRDAIQRYREGTTHDIDRNYFLNNDPSKPTPSNQVVSAEQASSDLTRVRQQEAEAFAQAENDELAKVIDQIRGYDPTQAQQQTQPEPQPQTPAQPEATPPCDFDLAAEFQKNPRLLSAVQEYTAQAQRQADAVAQYYTQAVQQNAEAAAASIVSQWPELRGLNSQEQFRTAIQTVAISNPERAKAMVAHIEQTRQIIGDQQRAAAAHQQAQQQYRQLQWNHDAKLADDDFDAWAATQDTPERVREVADNARGLLLREGFGEEQLGRAWNSDPVLRSAVGQKILYMASKYDLAQRGIQSKAHHPVPTVQRPGSPEAREPEANYRERQLSSRLEGAKGNDALRIAAEMVTARRNARR